MLVFDHLEASWKVVSDLFLEVPVRFFARLHQGVTLTLLNCEVSSVVLLPLETASPI
jgi:hypothetical protein